MEEEAENAQGDGTTLQFNEALSWRAGRPIAIGELHRRLRKLAEELKDLDQDRCDPASLTSVATELAHPNLLTHRDNGVKAWTAHCLVDILRLCAPHAPYSEDQLRVSDSSHSS